MRKGNTGELKLRINDDGYETLPAERKKFVPKGSIPYDTLTTGFDHNFLKSIITNIFATFNELSGQMNSSKQAGSRELAERIDWSQLASGKSLTASRTGLYWNYHRKTWFGYTEIEFQHKLTSFGPKGITMARFSEIIYVITTIILAVKSSDKWSDVSFIIPFIAGIVGSPFSLIANIYFVDPDDIGDTIAPKPLRYDIPTYEEHGVIAFIDRDERDENIVSRRNILDIKTMGFLSEPDIEFCERYLFPYTETEPHNIYPKTNYWVSWATWYGCFVNHLIGPISNWLAIGLATSAARNPLAKLIAGVVTYIPLAGIPGAIYYTTGNIPMIQSADESFVSSDNPYIQALRIAWNQDPGLVSKILSIIISILNLLEASFTSFTRALGLVASAIALYEYWGIKDMLSPDEYALLTTWTLIVATPGGFDFTFKTRGPRALAPTIDPLTFPTPFGNKINGKPDVQIITKPKILNAFGAMNHVKSKYSCEDRGNLIKSSSFYSGCWTGSLYYIVQHNSDYETALPVLALFPLLSIAYYYNDRNNLLRSRASKVISLIRGINVFMDLTDFQIRFGYICAFSDTYTSRMPSQAGGIILLPLLVALINLDPVSLWAAMTILLLPSTRVSFQYMKTPLLKASKPLTKSITMAAERKTSDGKEATGYLTGAKQAVSRFLMWAAPCLFTVRVPKPPAPTQDLKDIPLATVHGRDPHGAKAYELRVTEAYKRVTENEKFISDSLKRSSWNPCG